MVLPLFLAMNASELTRFSPPQYCAWMACQFSPFGEGLTNLPPSLPEGSMLILNDRHPCQGHSADLIASQILDTITRFSCESVLLDFQRPDNPETELVVAAILSALPCPVCVSECYGKDLTCPILLGPCPLHIPLEEYLVPWKNREVWLEAGLCQQSVTVTRDGADFACCIPWEGHTGGFYENTLCCNYLTEAADDQIRFTLFDTADTLVKKLEKAHSLGVARAVGLWQELSEMNFQ